MINNAHRPTDKKELTETEKKITLACEDRERKSTVTVALYKERGCWCDKSTVERRTVEEISAMKRMGIKRSTKRGHIPGGRREIRWRLF